MLKNSIFEEGSAVLAKNLGNDDLWTCGCSYSITGPSSFLADLNDRRRARRHLDQKTFRSKDASTTTIAGPSIHHGKSIYFLMINFLIPL